MDTSLDKQAPAIDTKQKLIDYTTAEWNALVAHVDDLSDGQWTSMKDAAGWSVKDHVAHVTKSDRAVIECLRNNVPMQETLGVSDTAWSDDSFNPMNEEIRQHVVDDSVQTVKAERDSTWTDLVSLLGELSEEQLTKSGAEVGLAMGERPLPEPVLQALVDYLGAHYAEHLRCIQVIGEGTRA